MKRKPKYDMQEVMAQTALDVVLADGKLESSDINIGAGHGAELYIECVFDDLPSIITLDSGSETSLENEYLLDEENDLRVRWTALISKDDVNRKLGKRAVHIIANHPTHPDTSSLHSKKNSELKGMVKAKGVEKNCTLTNNASMRKALWAQAKSESNLDLKPKEIELCKEDGKSILEQIISLLPIYVLFRADRPSTDQDSEVQDPMKIAIRTALEELKSEVDAMKNKVKAKALEVAGRTLESLRDFDVKLASSLTPEFADPKLESAFKLSLMGDDGIAVNKRGSGVRRLVLFSFFRAEAERKQIDAEGRCVIYAVEEPETAQHPNFQRMVVKSLHRLSQRDGCQVILTTHSPGLAGLLPSESIRFICCRDNSLEVIKDDDAMHAVIATLGVVPDHRVRVFVCVEGQHDRTFLQNACRAYRNASEQFVCLESDPAVAFILLGGSSLGEWANANLLRETNIPEFHIYDRDVNKYGEAVREVNSRGGKNTARQTIKLEMENYLCPTVMHQVLSPHVSNLPVINFTDSDDVEKLVSVSILDSNGKPRNKIKRRSLKHWFNQDVAAAMTAKDFDARDAQGEIRTWLSEITSIVRQQ